MACLCQPIVVVLLAVLLNVSNLCYCLATRSCWISDETAVWAIRAPVILVLAVSNHCMHVQLISCVTYSNQSSVVLWGEPTLTYK